jgi:hypothetical protein
MDFRDFGAEDLGHVPEDGGLIEEERLELVPQGDGEAGGEGGPPAPVEPGEERAKVGLEPGPGAGGKRPGGDGIGDERDVVL